MEQELTLLKTRIEKILKTELSDLLTTARSGGGGSLSEVDYRKAIQSPKLRSKLEDAINREVDDFFTRRRKEELFSSAVGVAIPTGPAAKLQRALVEECTRAIMRQFEKKTSSFRSHLSTIPDAMLNRRWIQRTFDGIFEDISKNSGTLLHGLNLSPVFSEILPEMLNTIEVSPTALNDLKRSINQEIIMTLNGFAGELPASTPSASTSQTSSSRTRSSGNLRINMRRGNQPKQDNGAESKLRTSSGLSASLDSSLVSRITEDLANELSAYIDAQLETAKKSQRSYQRSEKRSSPTIMPTPVEPEPIESSFMSAPIPEYKPPMTAERFLEPTPVSDDIIASATRDKPYFSAGTPGLVKTLVIHCSDPRIQETVRSLMNVQFALSENETAKVVIPGGIQTLTLDDYLPKFSWATRKWIDFMNEMHAFDRVICIAEEDCDWYKERKFIPFRPGGMKMTPEERQSRDLKLAADTLREMLPRAEIDLYHLSPLFGESAKLEKVQLDQYSTSS